MPDPASVPVNETVTGWLCHRPRSAGRSGVAAPTAGATESIFTTIPFDAVPPTLVARHSSATPAVSAATSRASHPVEVHADSGSSTVHLTFTGPRYQPSSPTVPVTVRVMTGAVGSPAAPAAPATASASSPV